MSRATDPPPLIPGLPGITRPPVLVTGGTGTIGSQVVQELLRSGVPARVLTRMPGHAHTAASEAAQEIEGDLVTGAGLAEAVDGVQAVVHCASNPTQTQDVDIDGTGRLCAAMAENSPDARLIHVSIVGCWDNPMPYYRAKAAAETVVTDSGRHQIIVRATQVHELVHKLAGSQFAGFGVGVRGLRFAPIESSWLAKQLVDHALDEQLAAATAEYAGPEILTARELAVLTAHVEGRRAPRVVRLPAVGGMLRRFAEGSNLPGPHAVRGGATYAQWLSDRQA